MKGVPFGLVAIFISSVPLLSASPRIDDPTILVTEVKELGDYSFSVLARIRTADGEIRNCPILSIGPELNSSSSEDDSMAARHVKLKP